MPGKCVTSPLSTGGSWMSTKASTNWWSRTLDLHLVRDGSLRSEPVSTAVTHDIMITAEPTFEEAHSDARAGRFLFSYRITIANQGRDSVRLLRRHWLITDSLHLKSEVEGPGVVGATPVLESGGSFTYTSACDLRSSVGRMRGTYLMERIRDGHRFRVTIPEMVLCFPYQLN
jgi:ApaG protein